MNKEKIKKIGDGVLRKIKEWNLETREQIESQVRNDCETDFFENHNEVSEDDVMYYIEKNLNFKEKI